jgi:hypothetical protein
MHGSGNHGGGMHHHGGIHTLLYEYFFARMPGSKFLLMCLIFIILSGR